MPHCIIEYTKELEATVSAESLINAVFQGALASELFEPDDIKTRAIAFAHCHTGADPANFIHVTVKLLAGRSPAQRKLVATRILDQLGQLPLNKGSLTVETIEIDTPSYAKLVR